MVEFGGIYNMYLRHICFVFINYFCSSLIKHTNELHNIYRNYHKLQSSATHDYHCPQPPL